MQPLVPGTATSSFTLRQAPADYYRSADGQQGQPEVGQQGRLRVDRQEQEERRDARHGVERAGDADGGAKRRVTVAAEPLSFVKLA